MQCFSRPVGRLVHDGIWAQRGAAEAHWAHVHTACSPRARAQNSLVGLGAVGLPAGLPLGLAVVKGGKPELRRNVVALHLLCRPSRHMPPGDRVQPPRPALSRRAFRQERPRRLTPRPVHKPRGWTPPKHTQSMLFRALTRRAPGNALCPHAPCATCSQVGRTWRGATNRFFTFSVPANSVRNSRCSPASPALSESSC